MVSSPSGKGKTKLSTSVNNEGRRSVRIFQTTSASTRSYSWRKILPKSRMLRQSWFGNRSSANAPSLEAASEILERHRSTASRTSLLRSKLSRFNPLAYPKISLIFSSISRSRVMGRLEGNGAIPFYLPAQPIALNGLRNDINGFSDNRF